MFFLMRQLGGKESLKDKARVEQIGQRISRGYSLTAIADEVSS
jgi:hypothetical protein